MVASRASPRIRWRAWISDIEIVPRWRGHGFGRGLLRLAAEAAIEHGVNSMGLNVFGTNIAQRCRSPFVDPLSDTVAPRRDLPHFQRHFASYDDVHVDPGGDGHPLDSLGSRTTA